LRHNGTYERDWPVLTVRTADASPHRNRGGWFPGALMPDWTNPEALWWWLDKRRYLVEELGIDGFKTTGRVSPVRSPYEIPVYRRS
jgi:hypothetical protein